MNQSIELIPYRCDCYAQVALGFGFVKFSRTTLLAMASVPT